MFFVVRPRRRLREDGRLRPPKLREDVVQPDGGVPEEEVGMGEIDEVLQDYPRVMERGWLRIGLEVLGESLSSFLSVLIVCKHRSFRLDCHPYSPSLPAGSRLDDPSLRPKGARQY